MIKFTNILKCQPKIPKKRLEDFLAFVKDYFVDGLIPKMAQEHFQMKWE